LKESSLKIYLYSDLKSSLGIEHIFSEMENYNVEVIETNKFTVDSRNPNVHIFFLNESNPAILDEILAIKNPRKDRYFFLVNDFSISSLTKLARRGFNKIYVLPDDIQDFHSSIMTEIKGLNLQNQSYYTKFTEDEYIFRSTIGNSESDNEIICKIVEAAKTTLNFVIQGEIGLGKSRLAKAIHNSSNFSKFIEIIPPFNLDGNFTIHIESGQESEYYDNLSDLDIARLIPNSTFFIKNVLEIDLILQKRLIRILDDNNDAFRIITTTIENLEDKIISGELNDELYYKINGSYIELTPLRYRPDDLQHLFNHLIMINTKKLNKKISRIEPDVFDFVNSYPWLGNIQELDNAIVNAITFSSNKILSLTDFANIIIKNNSKDNFSVRTTDVLPNVVYLEVDFLSTSLEELNRKYASVVLNKFEHNKSKVSEILGITRPTLKKLTE
jgi:DNA-binding NtrC family response regulator